VFPVRYELRFYTPEDGILHSHLRKNLKYINADDFYLGYTRLIIGMDSDYSEYVCKI
jgi:hypothetical protein